jgi:uncharacterized protein (TIGR02246 family)
MLVLEHMKIGRQTTVIAASAICISAALLVVGGASQGNPAQAVDDRGRQEIETFNKKYMEAHLKMDNAAIMATWAEDGVALLPSTTPTAGKAAIGKFLEEVTKQLAGYKMLKVEMDFQGIEVHGDWASEWGYEHQMVQPPDGKPVIDNYGKLLLVLRREPDGNWRVTREMWNQGMKP